MASVINEFRKVSSLMANFMLSRPFYASVDITNFCNLRCDGCDYPLLLGQKQLGKDLPLEGIEARIEALHKAFGSLVVVLAGFEPTVRTDLASIITAASRHNYVGIVTNGTLIDREKAKSYWKAGLLFASVSLPTTDDKRFREITQVQRYGVRDVKNAIETLIETAPIFGKVAITVTVDNQTTPAQMEEIIVYAKNVRAAVSFQPYSASKPASALISYDIAGDKRRITEETLETVFAGSLAGIILELKRKYGNVIGRTVALRNFDTFIREGMIPFKPRSLKLYTNGNISLYPERQAFSNIDARLPEQVWQDYRQHVEELRAQGPFKANNCYRCVNLTNPTTPMGDMVGTVWRAIAKVV
ncbi:radical SAM protein [Candidatus Woesearchaeota archaeon]|nr:radical SAM protein [Candidatus Woesearchaeota archaeon]